MKVGFIGFGEVSSSISRILLKNGIKVLSSLEGRSERTKELANTLASESNFILLNKYEDVARESDILISATSPKQAIAIGKKYGKIANDIFLDLNNISPITTKKLATYVNENYYGEEGNEKFVDGAIIGKVASKNSVIFVSGKNANKLSVLNSYGLNIKVVSENIGDASLIKILRSMYTKSLSALLIETFQLAESLNLANELFEIIAITEGNDFKEKSKSRIENSIKHSKRKYEELNEILEFLNSYENGYIDNSMLIATKNKFKKYINKVV